jgi:uncharacterized membrane protein YwzB
VSEFKAQILGVILVLGIFIALNSTVSDFFVDTWNDITNQISTILEQPEELP